MAEEHSAFHNEANREVHLSVSETDHPGVLVQMSDQFSQVEHLYSRAEALELYRVLGNVLYPRGRSTATAPSERADTTGGQ